LQLRSVGIPLQVLRSFGVSVFQMVEQELERGQTYSPLELSEKRRIPPARLHLVPDLAATARAGDPVLHPTLRIPGQCLYHVAVAVGQMAVQASPRQANETSGPPRPDRPAVG
jgi:hypothetical protein